MISRVWMLLACASLIIGCKSDEPWRVPSVPDLESSDYDITSLGCNEAPGNSGGNGNGESGGNGEGGGGGGGEGEEPCGGTPDRGGVTGGLFFGGGVSVNCGGAGGGGGLGMMGGEGGASGGNGEFGGGGGAQGGPLDLLPGDLVPEGGLLYPIDAASFDASDIGEPDFPDLEGDAGELCCFTSICEQIDPECTFTCGNGIPEGPEVCDGDCPTSCPEPPVCDSVGEYVLVGDPNFCDVVCLPADLRECETDGCCPEYCNYTTDDDCDVITGGVGSACDVDSDCGDPAEGHFCVNEGYRAGYCSFNYLDAAGACPVDSHVTNIWLMTGWSPDIICAADCETDEDCGGRVGYGCLDYDLDGVTECVQIGIGEKEYGEECQDTTQCAGGDYALCDPYVGIGEIEAGCSFLCVEGDLDCPEGLHCLGTRCYEPCETCVDGDGCCPNELGCNFEVDSDCPEPSDEVVGRPCTTAADCTDPIATCLTPEEGFPGGYCTYSTDDIAVCPDGSEFTATDGRTDLTCRQQCRGDSDCRDSDYECYDSSTMFSDTLICSPVGNGSTPLGGACTRTDECSGGRYAFCGERGTCEQRCLGEGLGETPIPCPSDDYACSALYFLCREPCPDGVCPDGYTCFPEFLGNPAICEPDEG